MKMKQITYLDPATQVTDQTTVFIEDLAGYVEDLVELGNIVLSVKNVQSPTIRYPSPLFKYR